MWTIEKDDKGATKFPAKLTAEKCVPLISSWLESDEAQTVELGQWENDCDHDGDNDWGWRVYCEDWGHVNNLWSAICAVKPVMLWYGK